MRVCDKEKLRKGDMIWANHKFISQHLKQQEMKIYYRSCTV